MASAKKWVAFIGNVTIPAEMAGEDEDKKIQVGEPVQVPAFYADSVVQDRIAKFCDAPKKEPAPKKKPAAKKTKPPTVEEKVMAEKAAQIEAAQTAVTDAQAALDAAEDTDAAEGARVALVAAQDALAALQS